MANVINVKSIPAFIEFLTGITKIVPSCKFEISSNCCKVSAINDNKTVRAYFVTDSVVSDDACAFSFLDLSSLLKSIKLLETTGEMTECKLNFDGTFISHLGKVKFKLKVAKQDAVEKFITTELKNVLTPVYSFDCKGEDIRRISSQLAIVEEDNSKVYFTEQAGMILAEMDDKSNTMSNSIAVPISDSFDGESQVVAVSFANFKLFGIFPGMVKVTYTDKTVLQVTSTSIIGDDKAPFKVGMKMICSSIKG